MEVTPYATLSAGELETQTAPLNWIVENLFLEAGAGILGGAPKSCKSFFALDLCVAIASGTPCAGNSAPFARVQSCFFARKILRRSCPRV